jgi:hypothetical protein
MMQDNFKCHNFPVGLKSQISLDFELENSEAKSHLNLV